ALPPRPHGAHGRAGPVPLPLRAARPRAAGVLRGDLRARLGAVRGWAGVAGGVPGRALLPVFARARGRAVPGGGPSRSVAAAAGGRRPGRGRVAQAARVVGRRGATSPALLAWRGRNRLAAATPGRAGAGIITGGVDL